MNMNIKAFPWLLIFFIVAAAWMVADAGAHHGWGWASEEEFEITGRITDVRLGNPHGEVIIDAGDAHWIVEVGQPWRNQRAGLTDERLHPGQKMTVHGHRSSRPGERVVKAERVVIDGRDYILYPDRKS